MFASLAQHYRHIDAATVWLMGGLVGPLPYALHSLAMCCIEQRTNAKQEG